MNNLKTVLQDFEGKDIKEASYEMQFQRKLLHAIFQHSKIVELIIFHSVVRNKRGQCIYNSQRGVFMYNQQLSYLLVLSFHHGCKTLPLGQGYFARRSKF